MISLDDAIVVTSQMWNLWDITTWFYHSVQPSAEPNELWLWGLTGPMSNMVLKLYLFIYHLVYPWLYRLNQMNY